MFFLLFVILQVEFSRAKNILTMKRFRLLPLINEDTLIITGNPEISLILSIKYL